MQLQQRWKKLRERLPVPSKREKWALLILFVPIGLGVVLSLIDQSSRATLIVDEPTPSEEMAIVAGNGGGTSEIRARPEIVSLLGVPRKGSEPAPLEQRKVELRLPVTEASCPRLSAALGGACGPLGEGASPLAGPLTVVWPSVADVSVKTTELSSLSVAQTPVKGTSEPVTTWNLRIGSAETVIEFECVEEARFHLKFSGLTRNSRCERGSALLSIPLLLPPSQVAAISLAGVKWWDLQAHGQRADLVVDRSELFVGKDSFSRRGKEIPIAISTEQSRGVQLEVDNPDGEADTAIRVEAANADGVEVSDENMLPSLLSKFEDYWFVALGMVGGVLLSVLLERIPPRD